MGEGRTSASQLREVHHLLTQGKGDEAQMLLAHTAEIPALQQEHEYLQAWYAASQENWEMVTQRVRDIPVFFATEERENLLTQGSVRRRRPMCLLLLGEMARELGYPEEAIEHIQHGISLLNERRMNIPEVRLLAQYSLARLALEMNQTAQALLQYKTALALYEEVKAEHSLHRLILMGLCETNARLEQFEQALAVGKQALALFEHQEEAVPSDSLEPLLLTLSRVSLAQGDHASALMYARQAQEVASRSSDPIRVARVLLVLAEVQQRGCHSQEARASGEQALALVETAPDAPLKASTFFLLGKLAEAEWRHHPEQETRAAEALAQYEQARTLFEALRDTTSLTRVLQHIAQLLEDRQQPDQALSYWKNAFMLSEQRG